MNNFETVNLTLYNRLYSYKNGRAPAPKDLDDLICHYMSYFDKAHKNYRQVRNMNLADIEMIYNHIFMDLVRR